jgi:hypothetical protein
MERRKTHLRSSRAGDYNILTLNSGGWAKVVELFDGKDNLLATVDVALVQEH